MSVSLGPAEYAQAAMDTQYSYPDPLDLQTQQNQFVAEPETAKSSAQKRKGPPSRINNKPDKKPRRVGPKTEPKAASTPGGNGEDAASSKPKRVRTGCLTCRERHLKCDEAWPHCLNCRKSNRQCKRGIKLNFIDTWVDRPEHIVTAFGTDRWRVEFLDESREIAAGYTGSTHKYPPLEQDVPLGLQHDALLAYNYSGPVPSAPELPAASLPQVRADVYGMQSQQPDVKNLFDMQAVKQNNTFYSAPQQAPNSGSSMHSTYAPPTQDTQLSSNFNEPQAEDGMNEKRDFLNTAEETLFMQVFVEEVGLWMDSMDPLKHFSKLLPFHALSEPMLLNAFLACGAKHLSLVNSAYVVEKALHHYDTATRYLLKNLQNPNRDTVICATTAVILNVYEVMAERPMQRMNHIAGARALIKECGWSARASGIGAACFWLNVGLEVMSCLHFNWQVAWDPDDWGIDMNFNREIHNGMEESWTHKMLYITGKVCNLRATTPRDVLPDAAAEQARRQQRYNEWSRLRAMANAWNDCIPRTMHPMGYVYPANTGSKSAFPEVWLVKRTTIVARLFYHTAMLLLSQINPFLSVDTSEEMSSMQRRHSQMTCGIVAHVKDRGVASVAIRSLAHAAEVLTDRREQEEVLEIFEKINKETGWRIGFVYGELKEKWGWHEGPSPHQYAQTHDAATKARESQEAHLQQQAQAAHMQLQQGFNYGSQSASTVALTSPVPSLTSNTSPPVTTGGGAGGRKKMPSGIPNPLYAKADFSLPQHPYQSFYVAPASGYGNPQTAHAWWSGETTTQ